MLFLPGYIFGVKQPDPHKRQISISNCEKLSQVEHNGPQSLYTSFIPESDKSVSI